MWKVILVDDEPGVTDGLSIMVDWGLYGFSVVGTAEDGPEALRLIQIENPDLVVTDIKMPEMDGLELVREAQRLPDHRPKFLIASGHKDFEYAREALVLGVEDYLIKPIYEEDLGQALAKLSEKLQSESAQAAGDQVDLNAVLSGDQDPDELMRSIVEQPFVILVGVIDDYPLLREIDRSGVAEADRRLGRFMARILKAEASHGYAYTKPGRTATLLPVQMIRRQHGSVDRYVAKLQSYVTVGHQPTSSFVVSGTLTTLQQAREIWSSLPRLTELLAIRGPNAVAEVAELLTEGANADPRLLKPDGDILHCVADGDIKSVERIVGESEQAATHGRAEPSLVVSYLRKLCFEFHRLVTELGGNPATVDELQRLCKSEIDGATLHTQFALLKQAATATARYVESLSRIRPSARMQQICRDLVRTFREDVTIRDLANRHGITPAYLGQLFKKEFGESFNDYRNRLRVEEAARLLRTTEMRVYEVAQHVGYQSTDYFERRFSAFFDTTPTAYRSAAHQGTVPTHVGRP